MSRNQDRNRVGENWGGLLVAIAIAFAAFAILNNDHKLATEGANAPVIVVLTPTPEVASAPALATSAPEASVLPAAPTASATAEPFLNGACVLEVPGTSFGAYREPTRSSRFIFQLAQGELVEIVGSELEAETGMLWLLVRNQQHPGDEGWVPFGSSFNYFRYEAGELKNELPQQFECYQGWLLE